MRRIVAMLFSILLLTQSYAFADVRVPARLSLVQGDVMFITADADDWEPAAVNMPLDEGDSLWCPYGAKAELQLPDGSLLRLDGGSQLNLLANEGSFMHFNLAGGRLYLKTFRYGRDNSLQIDADDTTVVPAPGSRLSLAMLPNAQEDVSIFSGSAYVEGDEGRTRVRAGEQISLEEGYSELLPLNPPDSWEKWNLERDRQQSIAANAAGYLPEELRIYSGELAANGRWVRTSAYGMVWRPSVIISGDWAPYRSGRWVWRGGDYVWLPAESWGWVPYHYGRWTVIGNYGWCWVPPSRGDVYWGPGYVGWYSTGSHVGWTPLAPGEIYYGYGNHGRHSVNITNVTVNVRSVNYRNRRHRGGTTIVAQNDFLRGRTATVQPVRTASVAVAIGSPRVKPPKENRPATVRRTQSGQTPPRFEANNRGELRQRFPRVAPAPAARQTDRQTAPVIAPQQRQEPQRRGATPAQQPQTPVRAGSKPRQETAPAARQLNQQNAPVTIPQLGQQPQRQEALPERLQQTPVRQERNHRQEAAPTASQMNQQPAPAVTPQQRQQPQRREAAPSRQPQTPAVQGEKPRQEAPQGELQRKRVWRVATPENGREKAPNVTEKQEKDDRDKRPRGRE